MTGSGLSKISPLGVLLAVLALLVAACGGSSEQRATTGPWPEANALFRQDVRWLGADDAYSVALGDDRVAWLFADSLVGTGSPPERPPFPTARNSIGLQIGSNPARTRMTFYWRTTRKGNPASFFPDERDVWFWPGDGERLGSDGPLLIFLMRIRQDPTGQPGWDFKADGWEAVRIANADEEPDAWRVEHIPSPPNPWGIVVGSASVLAHEGWLYAFSTREPPPHDVHLVRWPLAAAIAGDLSAPEWWAGRSRGFVVQTELAGPPAPLFEDGQTEFTVHEAAGEFVAVQTIGFGTATIGVRTAPALSGPWSDVGEVWRPPEADREGALIYAAKSHPELDAGDALAVTYIASNFDIATVIADESLYYPRFVRLRLK